MVFQLEYNNKQFVYNMKINKQIIFNSIQI